MDITKLFENWQIEKTLPQPFQKEVDKKRGVKYSTDPQCCSIHNKVTRGKKATLYPGVISAILKLLEAESGKEVAAAGTQTGKNGDVIYYCLEYVKEEKRRVLTYNPKNGQFKGGIYDESDYGGTIRFLPEVRQDSDDGEEFLAILAYASIEGKGNLYNLEFRSQYEKLKAQFQSGWPDREEMMRAAYICSDNLYQRIIDREWIGEDGIPFDNSHLSNESVPCLTYNMIRSGVYSPNEVGIGKFLVFEKTNIRMEYEIAEMQKTYFLNLRFPDEVKRLIPSLPDQYKVGADAEKILRAVAKTPVRTFMITGSAGVGKSTDAKIIAQVLGVPYYYFTCGPNTDEMELIASMVPNTSRKSVQNVRYPLFEDMTMDPATALNEVSGLYESGIGQEEAFQKILEAVFQKGYQSAKEEKDFSMVESSIIEACKRPSVIEIQEPTLMERSATLARLNALLDDTASIELLNGEIINRHPETIVILTTNMNYIGCRQFNESVLSRMGMVQHREDMSVSQMVNRAMRKTGFQDDVLLRKMAEIAVQIREHIKNEEIRGGICEYREYEDWVWSCMIESNILEAARDTVVGKASMEASEREEIMDVYIRPYFEEAV